MTISRVLDAVPPPPVDVPPVPNRIVPVSNVRMWIYVTAVILAGAGVVALSLARADFSRLGLLVVFLALSSLSSAIKLPLPLERGSSSLSLCYAIDVASLLFLGPYAATLVVAMGAWSQCTFRMRERNPLHRTLFSMATLALTMQIAGQLFTALRAGQDSVSHGLVLPLGAVAVLYFVLNTALVATAIAFSTGQTIPTVWRDNFLWSAPSYFVGAAAAAFVKMTFEEQAYPWWIVLLIIPAFLTYRSYRLFIERIDKERAEVRRASEVQLATIEALALAIEARDRTSPIQVRKMQAYAAGLARAVGMPADEIVGLKTATLLHDVGNLAVPEHIFSKPGPLTLDEFQKVKSHPRIGAEILKEIPFPYPVVSLIAAHHEHWDGKGYPAGLKATEIPVGARILAVVDSYTALSSHRAHRPASAVHQALATLRQIAGSILDPTLVETFIDILPELDRQFTEDGQVRLAPPDLTAAAAAQTRANVSALEDIAGAHDEARALYQIAQALGASLGLAESMRLIGENLTDLVPFSCSALFLLNEETGRLECRWAAGRGEQVLRPVTMESVDEIERILPALNESADGAFQSSLAARLAFNGAVIGALAVFNGDADAYSPDHRRVFQRVAEHASLVIRNSIIFERTQQDSFTDQLTRLPNRRYMLLYLTQQMARAEQRRSKLAVVMMDLNGFKEINDTLGHQAGDRALHEVASVLRSMVRSYDLCVRYGGDEFVVILWECDAQQAEHRRREVEDAVASMFFEARPGESRRLSVSAGVAVFPEDGQTHEELLAVADTRMYQRKARQKERVAAALPPTVA